MSLRHPASSLCARKTLRPSIMRRIARAFAVAKFAFWIRAAISNASFRSTRRKESCDAVIRVYDEAGNLIETHKHAGDPTREENVRTPSRELFRITAPSTTHDKLLQLVGAL